MHACFPWYQTGHQARCRLATGILSDAATHVQQYCNWLVKALSGCVASHSSLIERPTSNTSECMFALSAQTRACRCPAAGSCICNLQQLHGTNLNATACMVLATQRNSCNTQNVQACSTWTSIPCTLATAICCSSAVQQQQQHQSDCQLAHRAPSQPHVTAGSNV